MESELLVLSNKLEQVLQQDEESGLDDEKPSSYSRTRTSLNPL